MTGPSSPARQAAIDAAFPYLHGGQDFLDSPSLRASLEVPAGVGRGDGEGEA